MKKGPATNWLDELSDQRGPLLTLPEPGATDPTPGLHDEPLGPIKIRDRPKKKVVL